MFNVSEQTAVRQALNSPSGRDFLPSLPLLEAQFSTGAFLHALRMVSADAFPKLEDRFGCKICVVAFGSLGRSEFVPTYSDLDPLIIFRNRDGVAPDLNEIRGAILRPLLLHNPWLLLDDRDLVQAGKWNKITGAELKYPVYAFDELADATDERAKQRRWQVSLEATALYGSDLFEDLRQRIVPKLGRWGQDERDRISFLQLITTVPEFFASFENPAFLYKDAFKYWKTRFLREFYSFANLLNLLLGWYLDKHGEELGPRYLAGSSTLKIIRATKFAAEMDDELGRSPALRTFYQDVVDKVLKKHELEKGALLLFGDAYKTEPARLLHAMLATVLSRFAACWTAIYDENVRAALRAIPKSHANFDATFPACIEDAKAHQKVRDLQSKRRSYLKYMAAAADLIERVFPRGRLWLKQPVHHELLPCLRPFIEQGR